MHNLPQSSPSEKGAAPPPPDFEALYESLPSTGWLSKGEAELLHRTLLTTEGPVLEVGCFHGRSTCLLASAGRKVYCVDPFAGFSTEDPDGIDTLCSFLANLKERDLTKSVEIYRCRVEEWGVRPKVGLAYLDGDHTHAGTVSQIVTALQCGASVVAVHDVNDGGEGAEIKRACLELLGPWDERVERLAVWRFPLTREEAA